MKCEYCNSKIGKMKDYVAIMTDIGVCYYHLECYEEFMKGDDDEM